MSSTGGPENINKGIADYEAAGELETDEAGVKAIKMKIKKVGHRWMICEDECIR